MKLKVYGYLIRLAIKVGTYFVNKHTKELQKQRDRDFDIERSDVKSDGSDDNRRASESEARIRAGLRVHI